MLHVKVIKNRDKGLSTDEMDRTLSNMIFAVCRVMKIKPKDLVKEIGNAEGLEKYVQDCMRASEEYLEKPKKK